VIPDFGLVILPCMKSRRDDRTERMQLETTWYDTNT
jgi:hypothetical protein